MIFVLALDCLLVAVAVLVALRGVLKLLLAMLELLGDHHLPCFIRRCIRALRRWLHPRRVDD